MKKHYSELSHSPDHMLNQKSPMEAAIQMGKHPEANSNGTMHAPMVKVPNHGHSKVGHHSTRHGVKKHKMY